MDTEQENIRQQPSELANIKSPTLEALCQDLDTFINELNFDGDPKSTSLQINNYSLTVSVSKYTRELFFNLLFRESMQKTTTQDILQY